MWMVATRVPAMTKLGMDAQEAQRTADIAGRVPKQVQWKADNYNHLMEHPTIFYATALALALGGMGSGLNLALALTYVALRVAHSVVHTTTNVVMVRFALFMASSLVLIAMAVRGAMAVL
jgi:hypothetical protein